MNNVCYPTAFDTDSMSDSDKLINDICVRVPNINIEGPVVKAVLGDFNCTSWSTYGVGLTNPKSIICKLRQKKLERLETRKCGC